MNNAFAQPPDAPRDGERPRLRGNDRDRDRDREHDRGRFRDRDGRGGDRGRDFAPRGRGAAPFDDLPVPEELTTKIMEMMLEKFPDRYERIAELRDRNPRRFERLMRRMAPVAMEYYKLREEQPALAESIIAEFKNQERLHALSRQYQEAGEDAARRAEAEKEIAELVRAQDGFMEQRMEFRLKHFEERLRKQQEFLDAQRERLEKEKARREERITERIERIKKGDLEPDHPRFAPPGRGGPRGPFGPGRAPPPPGVFGEGGPPGVFDPDAPMPDDEGPPPRHRRFRGPPKGPPPIDDEMDAEMDEESLPPPGDE